jgi:2-dehydro-3-deoxyphosphooctonate aldolase (KDO 8-P synthase)
MPAIPSERIEVAPDLCVGGGAPLVIIAGPCVVESADHALQMSSALRRMSEEMSIPIIYKSSYDKANRSSGDSYRGPGLDEGLEILARVKRETGLPVLTDIHTPHQARTAAEVADVIQIPAFLCRQTDLLIAAAATGRAINVKKGPFLAPWDARNIVGKLHGAGNRKVMLTERGSSFGYNTLIVDFRSLPIMRSFGVPVVYDATHSMQRPGGAGNETAGTPEFTADLARAAVAVGVDALFFEVHEEPRRALSDASTQFPLDEFPTLLRRLAALDALGRQVG